MPEMEVNINSTITLPSDTINFIFEFTQPGSEEASENGNGVTSERTGNQFGDVAHCQVGSHDDPDVSAEISFTNDVNRSSGNDATQETLRSDVIEQINTHVTKRKSSEKSMTNSSQLSISKPQRPFISNQRQRMISQRRQQSISNPQQPSISSAQQKQQRPSDMFNMLIQNGQVVPRVYVQTPVQTEPLQKGEASTTRPQGVKKLANDKIVESMANNNTVEDIASSEKVEGTQITNSTKLALRNFLKKKSAANVGETNDKSVVVNSDPEVQILSTVGEFEVRNACDKDRACSDQLSNTQEDAINVTTGTESQKVPEEVLIVESSSPDTVQTSSNSAQKGNDDQLSNQQSAITESNAESTVQEIKQGDNNITSTSDSALSNESTTTTQEVDVVVLPSLLQPNVPKKTAKRRAERVPKEPTGIKKKKKKNPRECVECGKVLSSTTQYCQHMNIHYDRRPHKCNECGKAFRQRQHLAKHKLIHTGEKPYVCQHCDKAFRSVYARRDHERIHTGEKPCKCPHCDKMFRSTNALKEHEKGFHNIQEKKIYTCKVCGKTFSWSSALAAHKKRHADVWAYKCNKCSKAFKNYSALWNHKKTHSKEKPFECDICGQRLKKRGNLKRHILTQHEPEEAEECLKTSKQFENFRAKKNKKLNDL
ncbi:hypothetical protein ACROYT_G029721 [Oculina patagonica]